MNVSTPRIAKSPTASSMFGTCTVSEVDSDGQVCDKCGFETNSDVIFTLHKKNCPRI